MFFENYLSYFHTINSRIKELNAEQFETDSDEYLEVKVTEII